MFTFPFHRNEPAEAPKKARGVGGSVGYTASALEPFFFLITTSPRYWACTYKSLSDWMQKAVNHDLVVSNTPFALSESQASIVASPTSPVREQWEHLQNVLCDEVRLQEHWVKFTVVDKILTMFGDEDWNARNMGFLSMQHHVWWVSHVQPWFSLTHVRTSQEYIQTAMSALIMELWWRFVWARHTQQLYLNKVTTITSMDASTTTATSMDQESSSDEILDQSELGEGSESESESIADSTLDDSTAEEIILERDDLGKMKAFFEGSAPLNRYSETEEDGEDVSAYGDDSESGTVQDGLEIFRSTHRGIIGEEEFLQNIPKSQESENWLAEIPSATPLFFSHPRIGDALETIEKRFWTSGEWDCRPAFEVLLNLALDRITDFQLPAQTDAQITAQMSYAYSRVFVPFLQQVGIDVSANDGETSDSRSDVLDSLSCIWAFNPTFGTHWTDIVLRCTFQNLTNNGLCPAIHFLGLFPQLMLNADSKTDAQILRVYQNLHSRLVSRGTITPQLEALIKTLDSLTTERNALIRQDKKQLHSSSNEKLHRPTNSSCTSASGTNEHHREEDGDVEADPDAPNTEWLPGSLEARLHKHRMERVKQIDGMIKEVQKDLNLMTGAVDQIQSRRKKRSNTELTMDISNFKNDANPMPSTSAPGGIHIPTDEELWGLPSIVPDPS